MTELERVENLLTVSNSTVRLMANPDFKVLYEALTDLSDYTGSSMSDNDVKEIEHRMFFKETIKTLVDSKQDAEEFIKQNT